jgi:7-keto-8-aminopelargonate synthetase-like enzyme
MVGPPVGEGNDEAVLQLHAALSKNGVHCNVALFPAVRIGHARLRFQLMATLPLQVMNDAVSIIKRTYESLS